MSLYPQVKITDAVEQYKDLLATLRTKLKDEIALDSEKFDDDLFLVRFCLSQKGDEERTMTALKAAIEFRYKNKETFAKIATGWEHPDEVKLKRFVPLGVHHQSSLREYGSALFIIRGGIGSVDSLLENCTDEEISNAMIYIKEHVYCQLEKVTRETGYIKKMVVIQDMFGNTIWDVRPRFMGVMREVWAGNSTYYHPQLIGKICVVNAPSGFYSLLAMAKTVMPEALTSRLVICGAAEATTTPGAAKACPFVSRYCNSLQTIPDFLGGFCRCEELGGCTIVSNDLREKLQPKLLSSSNEEN